MTSPQIITRKSELFIGCVQLGKAQILRDCLEGLFSKIEGDLTSFSQLHDAVDANYYGGFLDDQTYESGDAAGNTDLLGNLMQDMLREDNEDPDDIPDAFTDLMNDVQTALSQWLQTGGLVRACEQVEQGTLTAYHVSVAAMGSPLSLILI